MSDEDVKRLEEIRRRRPDDIQTLRRHVVRMARKRAQTPEDLVAEYFNQDERRRIFHGKLCSSYSGSKAAARLSKLILTTSLCEIRTIDIKYSEAACLWSISFHEYYRGSLQRNLAEDALEISGNMIPHILDLPQIINLNVLKSSGHNICQYKSTRHNFIELLSWPKLSNLTTLHPPRGIWTMNRIEKDEFVTSFLEVVSRLNNLQHLSVSFDYFQPGTQQKNIILQVLRRLRSLSIVVPERMKGSDVHVDPAIPILCNFLHSSQCSLKKLSFWHVDFDTFDFDQDTFDFDQGLKNIQMIESCLCNADEAPLNSSLESLHIAQERPACRVHEGIPIDVEDFSKVQKTIVRMLESYPRLHTFKICMRLRRFAARERSMESDTVEPLLADYLQTHPCSPIPDFVRYKYEYDLVAEMADPHWPHEIGIVYEYLKFKRSIAASQLEPALSAYDGFRLRLETHYSRRIHPREGDIDDDDEIPLVLELPCPPLPKEEIDCYQLSLTLDIIRQHPEKLSSTALRGML